MRWRVLMALTIIGLILAGGLYCQDRVTNICIQMEQLLLQARAQRAPEPLKQACTLWESNIPLLSTLLHHQRLDEVGQNLSRSMGALTSADIGQCIAQIDSILYMLADIREYDHINWKTLF